jgi:hypothetical protein
MKDSNKHKADAEIKVKIAKRDVTLNLNIPRNWLLLGTMVFLMWRIPQLWKAVETALPLLN